MSDGGIVVLVCGGRDFDDEHLVSLVLDKGIIYLTPLGG